MAMIKVFPLVAESFDMDKAKENNFYVTRQEEFENTQSAVISDLEASINGLFGDYNRKMQTTLKPNDVVGIVVEILPERSGKSYPKAVLTIKY